MARQQLSPSSGEAATSIQYPSTHPHARRYTHHGKPLHSPSPTENSYGFRQGGALAGPLHQSYSQSQGGALGGSHNQAYSKKQGGTLAETLNQSYSQSVRRHPMPGVKEDSRFSILSQRSTSLPANIGEPQLPRLNLPERGRGKSTPSPQWAQNNGPGVSQNGQGPSLAAVRLLPIQSRNLPLSMENPLDRHRSSDVLLAPSIGSTVGRRVQQVARGTTEVQLQGLAKILEELERNNDHHRAREYVNAFLLPHLRNCLRLDDSTDVQLAALSVVSNLVSGPADLTDAVVQAGCAPYLIPLVSSSDARLSEEAVWALGNMAGDSSEVRELVLRAGIMPTLIKVIASDRWARNRDEVTSTLAQKMGSSSSAHGSLGSMGVRYSTPPPAYRDVVPSPRSRSSSNPALPTPFSPKHVEVRQPVRGGSVKNLIVPTIQVPRTAGPHTRKNEDDC